MKMSSFTSVAKKGHLARLKQLYSYVSKMMHATIRVRTEEPNFSSLPEDPNTWDQSIYGNVREEIPMDIPKLLGKFVLTTHYEDANLFHNIMTGRSITGILHLINKTPFDWYSNKQATCETTTYESEFVAICTYRTHYGYL